MSTITLNSLILVDKIMVTTIEMDKVIHYTGFNPESDAIRRIRPSASPDFEVELSFYDDRENEIFEASIVTSNVALDGSLISDDWLAIARVWIDGQEFYFVIDGDLNCSDWLIPFDGEPEELIKDIGIFFE